MEGWRPGPTADKGDRWTPAEAGEAARKLLAAAAGPAAGLRRAVTRDVTAPGPGAPGRPSTASFSRRAWHHRAHAAAAR